MGTEEDLEDTDQSPEDSEHGQEIEPGYFDLDDEIEVEEPPLSFWESLSEITKGLVALILLSVAVLALYVVGGVFLGFLTWAAPAVLAVSAALILARYLSRTR